MPGSQGPTVHEKLSIHELMRMESADVQKVQAMLPLIGDAEVHQLLDGCVKTGQAHLRAMIDYCKSAQLAQ